MTCMKYAKLQVRVSNVYRSPSATSRMYHHMNQRVALSVTILTDSPSTSPSIVVLRIAHIFMRCLYDVRDIVGSRAFIGSH